MRARIALQSLSRRAPVIAVGTFCAALLGYWSNAALWLPYALAIMAGSLALVLMGARGRAAREVDPEAEDQTSWIAHELAGKGSPAGSYLLAFFGVVTIILTGVQGAYALPAWAGLALGIAWAIANARYPASKDSDDFRSS